MKKNMNSRLVELIGIRPILYNPILADISESVIAGIFMSQLLYWCNKGNKNGYISDWFYKTIDELYEETKLKRNEQDRAIKIWNNLEILFIEKRGMPQKRYFRIDHDKLDKAINNKMGTDLYAVKVCNKCKQTTDKEKRIVLHKEDCPKLLKPAVQIAETSKLSC